MVWYLAVVYPAAAASAVARAALSVAVRANPSKILKLAERLPEYTLFDGDVMICPVPVLMRVGEFVLAEPPSESEGRNAPFADKRLALAFRSAPWARTMTWLDGQRPLNGLVDGDGLAAVGRGRRRLGRRDPAAEQETGNQDAQPHSSFCLHESCRG